jgi:hypothetical protein
MWRQGLMPDDDLPEDEDPDGSAYNEDDDIVLDYDPVDDRDE